MRSAPNASVLMKKPIGGGAIPTQDPDVAQSLALSDDPKGMGEAIDGRRNLDEDRTGDRACLTLGRLWKTSEKEIRSRFWKAQSVRGVKLQEGFQVRFLLGGVDGVDFELSFPAFRHGNSYQGSLITQNSAIGRQAHANAFKKAYQVFEAIKECRETVRLVAGVTR